MISFIENRLAQEQIKRNKPCFDGVGYVVLRKEGEFLYPEWIMEERQEYLKWLKEYRPKLP